MSKAHKSIHLKNFNMYATMLQNMLKYAEICSKKSLVVQSKFVNMKKTFTPINSFKILIYIIYI